MSATSAPGLAHICVGTRPHLRRDLPTSAPELAYICAGTDARVGRCLLALQTADCTGEADQQPRLQAKHSTGRRESLDHSRTATML
jgi:hypothetical protein